MKNSPENVERSVERVPAIVPRFVPERSRWNVWNARPKRKATAMGYAWNAGAEKIAKKAKDVRPFHRGGFLEPPGRNDERSKRKRRAE